MNMSDINIQRQPDGSQRALASKRSMALPSSQEGTQFCDVWHTRKAASREARNKAQKEPMKLFVVLETVEFVETATPEVLEKVFNEAGEFVLKK